MEHANPTWFAEQVERQLAVEDQSLTAHEGAKKSRLDWSRAPGTKGSQHEYQNISMDLEALDRGRPRLC